MLNIRPVITDDTLLCAQCGNPLPENPKEGTPAWDGFCCRSCMNRFAAQKPTKKRQMRGEEF